MKKPGRPKSTTWSERDLEILERVRRGATYGAVAVEFGLTRARIGQITQRAGWPRDTAKKPWPEEKRRQAQQLYAQGLSTAKIASMMGVTKHAIVNQLQRMRRREAKKAPLILAALGHHVHRLRTLGLSATQIAQALGLPRNTVVGYLWRGGDGPQNSGG